MQVSVRSCSRSWRSAWEDTSFVGALGVVWKRCTVAVLLLLLLLLLLLTVFEGCFKEEEVVEVVVVVVEEEEEEEEEKEGSRERVTERMSGSWVGSLAEFAEAVVWDAVTRTG